MKLPRLRLFLIPDMRCVRCGQFGYVDDKVTMCCGCMNIAILRSAKKKRAA